MPRKPFEQLVHDEIVRSRTIHPPHKSIHESYAIILEEVDEFWDHVKMKQEIRHNQAMLTELVQIAAVCQCAAEDNELVT